MSCFWISGITLKSDIMVVYHYHDTSFPFLQMPRDLISWRDHYSARLGPEQCSGDRRHPERLELVLPECALQHPEPEAS